MLPLSALCQIDQSVVGRSCFRLYRASVSRVAVGGRIVLSENGNSNCKRPQNPRHQSDQSHKVLGDGKTKNEMLFSVKIARGLQNENQNYSL